MKANKAVTNESRKIVVKMLEEYFRWETAETEGEQTNSLHDTSETIYQLSRSFVKSMANHEGKITEPDLRSVLVESVILSMSLIDLLTTMSYAINEAIPNSPIPPLDPKQIIDGLFLGLELSEISEALEKIVEEES